MQSIRALFQKSAPRLCLCAVCLSLAFHLPQLIAASFFGAAFLFYTVLSAPAPARWRGHFGRGFLFGAVYHLCIYHWLLWLHPLTVADLDGVLSVLVVVLAHLAASAIHALFYAIGFWLWGLLCRVSEKRGVRAALFACCLLLAQAATGVGELALPWARFTLPFVQFPALTATASFFGAVGSEALFLAISALLALACLTGVPRRRWLALGLAALVFFANLVFGLFACHLARAPRQLTVASVQTDYSSEEKWSVTAAQLRADCRSAALAAAERQPDLIVFPESVLASNLRKGDGNEAFFAALSEECDALIAAGCLYVEDGKTYNAVCLFDSTGLLSYNAKRHLVPFGEYLPWQDVLKVVLPSVGNMNFFRSTLSVGEGGVCGRAQGVTFGGLVCFDTLFSSLAAESAREGAQVLIAPTNDAWFKDSLASRQHLWHGTWRAVETGRSLVQSANTGISAIVTDRGVVLDEVPAMQSGVCVATVPVCDELTLYTKTGDVVTPICALLVLLGGVRLLATRIKRGAKNE